MGLPRVVATSLSEPSFGVTSLYPVTDAVILMYFVMKWFVSIAARGYSYITIGVCAGVGVTDGPSPINVLARSSGYKSTTSVPAAFANLS